MSILWESRYALRTKGVTSSLIRELLKLTQRPEVISFAGGLPAAEYFPVERFRDACNRVLAGQSHLALQYGPTEGICRCASSLPTGYAVTTCVLRRITC